KGIPHRYEVQARGDDLVVIDYATGLMWKRGLSGDKGIFFTEAEGSIRRLNSAKFAGFEDWRVPTLEEAMSLLTTERDAMEVMAGDSRKLHLDPIFEVEVWPLWTAD